MNKVRDFIKNETVLTVSFILALISCCFVHPDAEYLGYFDLRTLALLYCLMVVVAGVRRAGVFDALGHALCSRASNVRVLGAILIGLCFFSSMLVTNDVALLTFVPFTIAVLGMAGQTGSIAWIVVLQAIAANMGSVLTPVGNPQNLFLFSYFDYSVFDFIKVTLPIWLVSLGLVAGLTAAILPREELQVYLGERPEPDRRDMFVYFALFVVCLLVVFRVIPWWAMLIAVIAVLLVYKRKMLLKADFALLLTFVCFFVFSGNMSRIDAVATALGSVVQGHELLIGAGASQAISNVPAALLLAGFSADADGLLLGVDIGGLGTPIASLASLIALKIFSAGKDLAGKPLRGIWPKFLAANISILAILLCIGEAINRYYIH